MLSRLPRQKEGHKRVLVCEDRSCHTFVKNMVEKMLAMHSPPPRYQENAAAGTSRRRPYPGSNVVVVASDQDQGNSPTDQESSGRLDHEHRDSPMPRVLLLLPLHRHADEFEQLHPSWAPKQQRRLQRRQRPPAGRPARPVLMASKASWRRFGFSPPRSTCPDHIAQPTTSSLPNRHTLRLPSLDDCCGRLQVHAKVVRHARDEADAAGKPGISYVLLVLLAVGSTLRRPGGARGCAPASRV